MTRILHIDASPREGRALSRRLTRELVHLWRQRDPAIEVVYRDVGLDPPPPVDQAWIAAAFAPPRRRSSQDTAALALSDALIDELLSADLLVMGVPMYNFGIPSGLKAYIDQVVRVGRTFAFEPDDELAPYKPLAAGKRAVVVVASGDAGYEPGGASHPLNQVEPYLRVVLGFIGIESMQFIYVGNDEFGGERLEKSLASARRAVDRLAAAV